MDTKLKKFAIYSFLESIFLGVLFVYLFTWKPVGISFPIYAGVFLLTVVKTLFLVEGKDFIKRLNMWSLLTLILYFTSFVFVFRLASDSLIFAFITLPFMYSFTIIGMLNAKVYENFGVLSFITTPIIIAVSWFVDLFKFVSNLKFDTKVSEKSKSISGRILLGLILGVPVFLVLGSLLYSSDSVFASIVNDLWSKTFAYWFRDASAFFTTLSRMFVAFMVSVVTMVFNFSLYNKESYLNTLLSKTGWIKLNNWKKSWDVVVTSTFMFLINLLFAFFLVIQFTYLFGGVKNINGLNLSLTYAEYARRGFVELIVVASIVFVFAFVLNFKVFAKGALQNIIYRVNHLLMVLSVLVISFSANSRLTLYESAYGYTNLRLFVHIIIAVVALMYLVLYLSLLFKKGEQFVNVTLASLFVIVYLTLILVPFDSISTYLNYQRYLKTQKIDFIYLFNRSDEAVPVMKMIVDDEKVAPEIKEAILANVKQRYVLTIKDQRLQWQSYNYVFNKIKNGGVFPIKDVLDEAESKIRSRIDEVVNEYGKLLQSGDFDLAFEKYWSPNTQKIDKGSSEIKVFDYDLSDPGYSLFNWTYKPNEVYITVECTARYSVDADLHNAYFPNYSIRTETLYLRNYDGVWKIVDSTLFKLGGVGGEVETYNHWSDIVVD